MYQISNSQKQGKTLMANIQLDYVHLLDTKLNTRWLYIIFIAFSVIVMPSTLFPQFLRSPALSVAILDQIQLVQTFSGEKLARYQYIIMPRQIGPTSVQTKCAISGSSPPPTIAWGPASATLDFTQFGHK